MIIQDSKERERLLKLFNSDNAPSVTKNTIVVNPDEDKRLRALFDDKPSKIDSENNVKDIEEPGAFETAGSRIAADIEKRKTSIMQSYEDYFSGEIVAPIAKVQALGDVAGGIYDVAGEVFNLGVKGVSYIVPDFIEDPVKEKTAQTVSALLQTGAAQEAMEAIEQGELAYNNFKGNNPQTAKTLESVANIAMLFAPAKVKATSAPKQKPVSTAEKVSKLITKGAEKQIENRKTKKGKSLILPIKPEPEFSKEKNILGYKYTVQETTDSENDIIKSLGKLNIDIGASSQKSRDIVKEGIETQSRSLEQRLKNNNVSIPIEESTQTIQKAMANALDTDAFVRSNELGNLVEQIGEQAIKILSKNSQDAVGILKSRKELDNYIKSYKANKSSFPDNDKVETALSIAVRDIRTSLNDLVAEKVPSAKVKESLKDISNLYRANVPISDKARLEGTNSIARLGDSINRVTGLKLPTTPLAVSATVGAAVSSYFAPVLAGTVVTGGLGYAGYRALISPATKKYLAKLLVASDKALKTATNPDMLKQIRADRAVVLELLERSEVSDVVEEESTEEQ